MKDKSRQVYIIGMGHYHPKFLHKNSFFDKLDIGSDGTWVKDRTGIESRASVLDEESIIRLHRNPEALVELRKEGKVESIGEMGEKTWKALGERLDLSLLDPELLICGTSVPDYNIPANANAIAARLKLNCYAFDANSACSSFVTDLHIAKALMENNSHKEVVIFNPERYSLRMDFRDRNSCILFGDGSSVAYLSSEKKGKALRVVDTVTYSDSSGYELVQMADGKQFSQNGSAVQKFAITKTLEAAKAVLEKNSLTMKDLTYFIGHQANLRMIQSACKRLGLSEAQNLFNADVYGNQGAAGAPAVLSMHWDQLKVKDRIVIAVVGSGLTWGACLLEVVN